MATIATARGGAQGGPSSHRGRRANEIRGAKPTVASPAGRDRRATSKTATSAPHAATVARNEGSTRQLIGGRSATGVRAAKWVFGTSDIFCVRSLPPYHGRHRAKCT